MFIPNQFAPSAAAHKFSFDDEGRLHEFNLSRQSTGGIGEANSLYATDAERFGSIAPFMRLNMAKDRPRRNYFIQPGGAIIYVGDEVAMERAEFPDGKESFGHNSMDGNKLVQGGRAFTVGGDEGINT